jgi:Tol biopolymer transport system component
MSHLPKAAAPVGPARRIALPLLLAGAVVLGCNGTTDPDAKPVSRIVYERDGDIAAIEPDGTGDGLIVVSSDRELSPASSVDGRVAFVRQRPSQNRSDIVILERDGRTASVTPDSMYDSDPAWSPDGRQIAVRSLVNRESGVDGSVVLTYRDAGIYIMNADGSGRRRLTSEEDAAPAWSPDGSRLVVARADTVGSRRLVIVSAADGLSAQQLTSGGAQIGDTDPSWSPDGARIAFSRMDPSFQTGVFLIGADGSGLGRLIGPLQTSAGHPSWSPDGREVVYTDSDLGGLAIMAVDSSNRRGLGVSGASPRW